VNDDALAASLAAHLDRLTFVDRSTDEVTALLVDAVAAWGEAGASGCTGAPRVSSRCPPRTRTGTRS
jgi:hypothetical protein